MRLTFFSGAAVLAMSASAAHAQRLLPSTTGFSVAAAGTYGNASAKSQDITSTAGRFAPRAELAYGVSPRLSLLGAIVSRGGLIEGQDYDVRSVDLGGRYLGFAGRVTRPFVEGGLSIRTFILDSPVGDVSSTNVGPWGAAGYMWFPGGGLALEAAATYGRVTFNNWRVGGNPAAAGAVEHRELGVRAGARWFFRPR
ncbi:hypothetical protein [Gemmatimonas sp.]|jgi:hypothetical protein|uniref:hypothetical protein n=1 Tax=Gemmatimonas sp. TaxID=1962908 RepID=UPI0037C1614C